MPLSYPAPPRLASGLSRQQLIRLTVLVVLAIAMLLVGTAHAGTTGTEFTPLYTMLTGWMTGYLGRIVAAIFIIVGLIAGITQGSVMGFATGIAAGVGMFLAPNIIDGTVTATLPVMVIVGG
ncbi:TraA family conjugative transfer protein [uncultured Thiodictyon sp.]|uniref:TraA family conjugative transfer protein n=1 Tax=uncultured Thiodictyon sp. TaxID=1846217 RepID=UPI0025E08EB5|nr:TraA family conjugative transfer protein [uncultured Thiodictyon sp.]